MILQEPNKHNLLKKQLQEIYGQNFNITDLDERTQQFLSKVNASYKQFDYQVLQNNVLFEEEENIVFTIGMKSGVLRANKKFYKTFGFTNLEDFKQHHECICELFIEEEGYLKETTSQAHWTFPITQNPNKQHKAILRNHLGVKCTYSVTLKHVELEDTTFKICTFSDITELEKTLHALNKSKEAKMHFMSNMSHEIRTPLNAILGFSDLLLSSTQLSNEQKEYVDPIKKSGLLLSEMVSEILDFSKLENKKLELELTDVNLFIDLYKDLNTFKGKFKAKNIGYLIDIDPTISESLIFDKALVMQALFHLISNAIKFTPEKGQVLIEIRKLEENERHEQILFSVQDTGIGIDAKGLKNIFDAFTQIDGSSTKQYQGLGLGLSITKSICEKMGTELMVESVVNKGSTFSFALMLEKSQKFKTLSEKRRGKVIYIIESSGHNFLIASNELRYLKLEYQTIKLQEFNEELLKNEIVILFDYRIIESFNLKDSKIILIEEGLEALRCFKAYPNVEHIESIINCPACIYKVISEFNDLE